MLVLKGLGTQARLCRNLRVRIHPNVSKLLERDLDIGSTYRKRICLAKSLSIFAFRTRH